MRHVLHPWLHTVWVLSTTFYRRRQGSTKFKLVPQSRPKWCCYWCVLLLWASLVFTDGHFHVLPATPHTLPFCPFIWVTGSRPFCRWPDPSGTDFFFFLSWSVPSLKCVHTSLCKSRWNPPRGLIISYSCPIKKVESASPSLWKFHTTPSRKITTKPSNNCWKRRTRGQSSSLPVKKTYGERRSTFWLHPCCSGALMICYIEVFNLWVAAPEERLEAQIYHVHGLCLQRKHTYNNTNTSMPLRRSGNTDHNKATEILFHLQ